MKQDKDASLEKRTKITAIADLLIDRYLEQKQALAAGDRAHAIALQFEIKELLRERETITKSAVWPR
jgi:hypothetical protein